MSAAKSNLPFLVNAETVSASGLGTAMGEAIVPEVKRRRGRARKNFRPRAARRDRGISEHTRVTLALRDPILLASMAGAVVCSANVENYLNDLVETFIVDHFQSRYGFTIGQLWAYVESRRGAVTDPAAVREFVRMDALDRSRLLRALNPSGEVIQ